MSSFLIVAFFSGNYMVWLPRNLPERGALRYLLHRGRERVIPGILNLPHPAGASRPGQPGANPQANTLNLRKNADHRPGVEYRTNANADDGPGLAGQRLADIGMIRRVEVSVRPLRTKYQLTDRGRVILSKVSRLGRAGSGWPLPDGAEPAAAGR
jgi:hypothetical protein